MSALSSGAGWPDSSATAPTDPARLGLRRPQRRGVLAAVSFIIGISLANVIGGPNAGVWFSAAAITAVCAALLTWRSTPRCAKPSAAMLALSMMALGGGWFVWRTSDWRADDIAHVLHDEERLLVVEGIVLDAPRTEPALRGRMVHFSRIGRDEVTRFTLACRCIVTEDESAIPVSGTLWVKLGEAADGLQIGDSVRLMGYGRAIEQMRNPGETDGRKWAHQSGISGRMRLESQGNIEPAQLITPAASDVIRSWWSRMVHQLRSRAADGLEQDAEPGHDAPTSTASQRNGLLRALLLGQRHDTGAELNESFTRLGLAHILAISGLHLAIVMGMALLAVRLLGDRPRLELCILLLLLAFYLLLVPTKAPIMRAGSMIGVFLIVERTGRRYDRLNTLAWIMVAVLILRPLDLFAAGFQLTFGIVAGLMILAGPLRDRIFGPKPEWDTLRPRGHLVEWMKQSLSASVCAWAVATPLVAFHIGIFSLWAPIMTLIVLPIVCVLLVLGLAIIIVSTVLPGLADPALAPLNALASVLVSAVDVLDRVPLASINVPPVSVLWTIGATLVVLWWLRCGSWRRLGGTLATGIVLIWFGVAWFAPSLRPDTAMRLDAMSVGDGSCYLIRSGDHAMIYDCGSLNWLSLGERAMPEAMRALRAWQIDTIVVSHTDLDHFCGVPDLIRRLGVRRVFVGEATLNEAQSDPASAAAEFMHLVEKSSASLGILVQGDAISFGEGVIRVLSPEYSNRWMDEDKARNNNSLVLLFEAPTEAGPRQLLMCGDIESEAIDHILEFHPDLSCDVMEAPHHGSAANSSAMEFVARLAPQVVVQSTGPQRVGDARWDDVRASTTWLDTPTHGSISVIIRRDGSIDVETLRRAGHDPSTGISMISSGP